VWAHLGGTELGWIADFSVKLSSAQKTVSLVSSKFVHRWRYHIHNWICGVAQTPYTSWDRIKCNNTWGVSSMPYGSWDSKLGCMEYALHRQRAKDWGFKKFQKIYFFPENGLINKQNSQDLLSSLHSRVLHAWPYPKISKAHGTHLIILAVSSAKPFITVSIYFGTNLKKHYSDGQHEQLIFKYFPIYTKCVQMMSSAQDQGWMSYWSGGKCMPV
jgi:hypothetical protein